MRGEYFDSNTCLAFALTPKNIILNLSTFPMDFENYQDIRTQVFFHIVSHMKRSATLGPSPAIKRRKRFPNESEHDNNTEINSGLKKKSTDNLKPSPSPEMLPSKAFMPEVELSESGLNKSFEKSVELLSLSPCTKVESQRALSYNSPLE